MSGIHALRKRLSLKKIKSQITISIITVTSLSVLFIAVFMYKVSSDRSYKMYRDFNWSNMNAYSKMLDMKMENFIWEAREQVMRDDFLEQLRRSGMKDAATPRFNSATVVGILPALKKIISIDHAFSEVAVFDLAGHCQMAFQDTRSTTYYQKYYSEFITGEEEWYKSALKGDGKEIFWGCDVLNPSNKEDISFVKLLKSTKTFEPVGVLVVAVSKDVITDLMQDWDMGQKAYSISIRDNKLTDGVIYSRGREPTERDLSMSCRNSITGWEIVNATPYHILNQDSLYIKMILAVMVVLVFMMNMVLSFVISRRINGPLNLLQQSIIRMKENNCGIDQTFDDSEIGEIGSLLKETVNYNLSLNQKLNEMRVKEKDAQLLLLQSQINPHFLYNTLDSLYCMAIIDGADDVAEMVSALSDMFRLSLVRGKRYLLLSEELDYIKKYMQIQNMRYDNRFEVDFSVCQEAGQCYILKFLIQPFVENAVYHGLEPKIGKGRIQISGWIDEELCIMVQDDGVGIDGRDKLETGYGIRSVQERIRLFYGEEYGVSITSRPGEGTRVLLRIPPWGREQYESLIDQVEASYL